MFSDLKFVFVFTVGICLCDSGRILGMFPNEAKSHHFFHKQMMITLANAGHLVTFVSPFPESNSRTNFTHIDSRSKRVDSDNNLRMDFKRMSMTQFIRKRGQCYLNYCRGIMENAEILNFLKSNVKHYDIMFVEMMALYECFLPLAEKLGIPVIGTFSMRSWMVNDETLGNPHPLFVPSPWSSLSSNKMSFLQRMLNALGNIHFNLLTKYSWNPLLQSFYQEYFPNFDLKRYPEISLLFSNYHSSIFPTPLVPNVVEIAGMHLTPAKPLPKTLSKFIDEAENGVIVFSLGSVTQSNVIEMELRNIFRETFANLQQRVIWKFEEYVDNVSENVLIMDWIPQRDILTHKNVKLFISHCGISGMYEAIDAAVPMIIIPLFFDQFSNAVFLNELEVGVQLDLQSLTKEILLNAINDLLNDNKNYSENMRKLSAKFKDRPMTPQQSVVYWTEYVLRYNGSQHLKSVSADVPLYQYFLLDIMLLIILVIFSIIYVVHLLYKFSYRPVGHKEV